MRIGVMSYLVRTFYQPSPLCLEKRLHSSRTVIQLRQLTERTIQCGIRFNMHLLLIPAWLWPPNSPHLNPVDYEVWAVLRRQV